MTTNKYCFSHKMLNYLLFLIQKAGLAKSFSPSISVIDRDCLNKRKEKDAKGNWLKPKKVYNWITGARR